MTLLNEWHDFYVIVGSAAGGLTGLLFVVMALIADLPTNRAAANANDAFSTPNIVHFGAVLLLSGLVSAPWTALMPAMVLSGIEGGTGIVYCCVVARRFRNQTAYAPVLEDRMFHVVLPLAAYAAVAAGALATVQHPREALFVVAAGALLLLFVGVHNAWDSVTYLVFVRKPEQDKKKGTGAYFRWHDFRAWASNTDGDAALVGWT